MAADDRADLVLPSRVPVASGQKPLATRLLTTLIASIATLAVAAVAYQWIGAGVAALLVLPVVVAGAMLGLTGGLVGGVLAALASNLLIAVLNEQPLLDVLNDGGWASFVFVAIGGVVGRMGELGQRLRAELTQRERATQRLEAVSTQLSEAQEVAGLGQWEWHVNDDIVIPSWRLLRMIGLDPRRAPATGLGVDVVHPRDRAMVRRTLARALDDHQPFTVEVRIRRPDATIAEVLAHGVVIVDDAGAPTVVRGTAQNITERKAYERRLATQSAVSAALAESTSLAEAAPAILSAHCRFLGWDVAALWVPEPRGEALVMLDVWREQGVEGVEPFIEDSRSRRFERGYGLPGHVWATGDARWLPDLGEPGFMRTSAIAADLRTGLAFPVAEGREVLAVIELFSIDVRPEDPQLVQLVVQLGQQTGLFARRRATEDQLRLSAAQRGAFMAASLDGFISMDHLGRITDFNEAAERIFGYERSEAVGQRVGDLLIPPSLREQHEAALRRQVETGRSTILGRRTELVAQRKDGTEFPIELSIVRVDMGPHPFFMGSLRDITDQRAAQDRLQLAVRLQSAVAQLGQEAVGVSDADQVLHHAAMLVGDVLRADEAVVLQLVPGLAGLAVAASTAPDADGDQRSITLRGIEGHAVETATAVAIEDLSTTLRFEPSASLRGTRYHAAIAAPVQGGRGTFGVIAAYWTQRRDFTDEERAFLITVAQVLGTSIDRARADQNLRQTLDTLTAIDTERRQLLGRLVHAQEEERTRIGEDIHDDSVQVMTAVGMRLQSLARRLEDEEDLRRVAELEEVVGRAVGRLRHLMFELRPPTLDRDGVGPALRLYLTQFTAESAIPHEFVDELPSEPPADARVVLYRVAQEALVNVRKHANASKVVVSLKPDGGGVRLRIVDDGIGLPDRAETARAGHLGLVAMRERAEMAGGRVIVSRNADRGTTVECWVPYVVASVG